MNYKVIITKKNIKNIIFRIKEDGNLYISAPKSISKTTINNLIKEKESWILERLNNLEVFFPKSVDKTLKNGDNIMYIGKKLLLKLFHENKNCVFFDSEKNELHISYKIFSDDHIKKLLENWYRKEAIDIFSKITKYYANLINKELNSIKVRKMKNKWGICRYTRKEITFNVDLIKKPLPCIEYVCLHEVVHLIFPHHKKEFWNYLATIMPDWKIRKDRLNKNE